MKDKYVGTLTKEQLLDLGWNVPSSMIKTPYKTVDVYIHYNFDDWDLVFRIDGDRKNKLVYSHARLGFLVEDMLEDIVDYLNTK